VKAGVSEAERVIDGLGKGVSVWKEVVDRAWLDTGVKVAALVEDKRRFVMISPKEMATTAKRAIPREAASHCRPAVIRAWRVR